MHKLYATDFIYDGVALSDFGFTICSFDGNSGVEELSVGSNITFNKTARYNGRYYSLTSTQYDECYTATFDICKNTDLDGVTSEYISDVEFRDIMRWLNRREFLKFTILKEPSCSDSEDDEDSELAQFYFDASFNATKMELEGRTIGLRLTMETNRPYAYGDDITETIEMESGTEYSVKFVSDDLGYIYPTAVITCMEDGDLEIVNSTADSTVTIANVVAGEVITLDGETLQISSTETGHSLYDDFNYEFVKLVNEYASSENIFASNLACTLALTYTPVIKDCI